MLFSHWVSSSLLSDYPVLADPRDCIRDDAHNPETFLPALLIRKPRNSLLNARGLLDAGSFLRKFLCRNGHEREFTPEA